jgi:hypothetical protein
MKAILAGLAVVSLIGMTSAVQDDGGYTLKVTVTGMS